MGNVFALRPALMLSAAAGTIAILTACTSPPAPCHDTSANNPSPSKYDYEQPPSGGGFACNQNAISGVLNIYSAPWEYPLSPINDYIENTTPVPLVGDAVIDKVFEPARDKWLETGATMFIGAGWNDISPAISNTNNAHDVHMIELSPSDIEAPAMALIRTDGAGQVLECDIHFYKESYTSSASQPIRNGGNPFKLHAADLGSKFVMPHVLQHELGHCLGLAHQGFFNHTDSVMSEVWGGTDKDRDPFFSPGDQDALKHLYGP